MQPGNKTSRIVTVDALRGFALLGILLAHFIYWHTAGPLPQEVYSKDFGIGSTIVNIFGNIFITGKFFTFFSFLFGLSFYLQMQSLNHDQKTFVARFSWRLILLMIIGLIHHAFWMGDILSIYVPLGFVLLLMRRMSDKAVLITGILLALNLPGKIINIITYLTDTTLFAAADFAALGKRYAEVITHGNLLTILQYNMSMLMGKYQFQVESGRLFVTLGFFLLGMYTGRKKWLENPEISKALFGKICKYSGWIVLSTIVVAGGMFAADQILKLGWQENKVATFVFMTIYDIHNATMVTFYLTGLSLLMFRKFWQRILHPLAPIGRMALTCYLMQTFFGLLLFYNIGFGLFMKTTPGWNYIIAFGLFILQAFYTSWWFKYFRYGIIEWLWRSATLLKWQPIRKRVVPAIPVLVEA